MSIKKPKLYKEIYLLAFLLFIVFSVEPVSAQSINYCLTGIATFNKILASGHLNWTGVADNIKDNNLTTYIGFVRSAHASDGCDGKFEGIVDFGTTVPQIDTIEYKVTTKNSMWCSDRDNIIRAYIYNPTETQIDYVFNNDYSLMTWQKTIPGPWYNVTGVKVYVQVRAHTCGMSAAWCEGKLFEIKAWGPYQEDIGLKMQTPSGIVSIAAEIGAPTSPLRIAKDGVVYGVALVNPGDANDSGVRIKLASGETKALRKL